VCSPDLINSLDSLEKGLKELSAFLSPGYPGY